MAHEYIGVDGVSREIKSKYIGVSGVSREIKNEYVGVEGISRLCFGGIGIPDSLEWTYVSSGSPTY